MCLAYPLRRQYDLHTLLYISTNAAAAAALVKAFASRISPSFPSPPPSLAHARSTPLRIRVVGPTNH